LVWPISLDFSTVTFFQTASILFKIDNSPPVCLDRPGTTLNYAASPGHAAKHVGTGNAKQRAHNQMDSSFTAENNRTRSLLRVLRFRHVCLTTALLGSAFAGCATGPFATSGTLGGGLAGGAIGALAGLGSDRAAEGAAIGAVTGGLLGNATGNALDQNVNYANARDAAFLQQARSQALTTDQVIQMSRNGVGEQLIVNQMRTNGVLAPLTTNDMILLKQNGVSDNVISAWQQTPAAGTTAHTARVAPIVVTPIYDDFHCPPGHGSYGYPCRY